MDNINPMAQCLPTRQARSCALRLVSFGLLGLSILACAGKKNPCPKTPPCPDEDLSERDRPASVTNVWEIPYREFLAMETVTNQRGRVIGQFARYAKEGGVDPDDLWPSVLKLCSLVGNVDPVLASRLRNVEFYECHSFDLDGDGNDENILVLDMRGESDPVIVAMVTDPCLRYVCILTNDVDFRKRYAATLESGFQEEPTYEPLLARNLGIHVWAVTFDGKSDVLRILTRDWVRVDSGGRFYLFEFSTRDYPRIVLERVRATATQPEMD
jgi:hypothetical protein